ncbi:hypothetical protein [Nitrospira moscoviensis]|uniref:Uncharacterized protein n=1 Tax=Nitrospira moscoviensis TaxID=42253 RepID=A0A0K2GIZ3_NITMO|nr:hypothetical protein [Nitrospira moscoviensis]ALA60849.1 conserved exported protein of unknown function [Nitrospira moscoviensis]
MKLQKQGGAVLAAVALVVGMASTALAIEAFQERFEWGDMSKPTTLQGRVIVLDPYDEAVWINIAVFGGNAESGLFWQKIHPGKTLKFYADKGAWEELKKMGRVHAGPAAAKEVPPSSTTDLIEFVAQETEQNHRVITSVKKLPEVAGAQGKPLSISALRLKECAGKSDFDSACASAKQSLTTSPKGADNVRMQYDVMIPGGKPVGGLIPWTASYNQGH